MISNDSFLPLFCEHQVTYGIHLCAFWPRKDGESMRVKSIKRACSVMSNSLQPYGLQPTRLLCLWDSPGKNTGVGCHALLQGIFLTQESNPHLLYLLHYRGFFTPEPAGKPKLILMENKQTDTKSIPVLGPAPSAVWIKRHKQDGSLRLSSVCQCLVGTFSFVNITVQFTSVAQSCLTFCDPMNRSMPGLPVHHQLPEFTQTHVYRVSDAIQSSHPLSSPSPPAPNLSQHQGLFQ